MAKVEEEKKEMTIDINKKYRTRDGRKVEIISDRGRRIMNGYKYPIVGYIEESTDYRDWAIDGSYNASMKGMENSDLVEVRDPHTAIYNYMTEAMVRLDLPVNTTRLDFIEGIIKALKEENLLKD